MYKHDRNSCTDVQYLTTSIRLTTHARGRACSSGRCVWCLGSRSIAIGLNKARRGARTARGARMEHGRTREHARAPDNARERASVQQQKVCVVSRFALNRDRSPKPSPLLCTSKYFLRARQKSKSFWGWFSPSHIQRCKTHAKLCKVTQPYPNGNEGTRTLPRISVHAERNKATPP